MTGLTGLSVGILAADGVEQVEVTAPRDALRQAGASVRVLSPDGRARLPLHRTGRHARRGRRHRQAASLTR